MADNVEDFNVMLGHELAMEIRRCREAGRKLDPDSAGRAHGHVSLDGLLPARVEGSLRPRLWIQHGRMERRGGQHLPPDDPSAFQYAMEGAFYGPLGDATVPEGQRFFATRQRLPEYGERIATLRSGGAKLVIVYGIGRMCHIAFWEPHFGAEFPNDEEWRKQTHRLGAKLHPLTIEQNAITSFKSRTTLVPAFANTIGPALFTRADYAIGGADGELGRGMQWQGSRYG